MRKWTERAHLTSAWNRAHGMERVFVLLGRDPCAGSAINAWCELRIRGGYNNPNDSQIVEAHKCAEMMTEENTAIRALVHATQENMADPDLIPPPIPEAK